MCTYERAYRYGNMLHCDKLDSYHLCVYIYYASYIYVLYILIHTCVHIFTYCHTHNMIAHLDSDSALRSCMFVCMHAYTSNYINIYYNHMKSRTDSIGLRLSTCSRLKPRMYVCMYACMYKFTCK
jgi:hypothetical protein